jgi:hypothetical protein
MQGIADILRKKQEKYIRPSEDQLRSLPYLGAFISGRLSTPAQVKDSHESIREIADLVGLAIKDGYQTKITREETIKWLIQIQKGEDVVGFREDGQLIIDVRDLGISGSISSDGRPGLANLQRKIADGLIGAAYVTEINRFSRDKERITPYQLLKLFKDHNCRVRTPEGKWNPNISRDWEYLQGEFEAGIEELGLMSKRLHRKRKNKAARGEFVGEGIMPGFVVPIIEVEPSGRQRYGRYQPYEPHAEVVRKVLKEFIKNNGSPQRTLRALGGECFYPLFPPELKYMERLTALRRATKTDRGYRLSPGMVRSLATNPKIIGAWDYGDVEPIVNNHEPIAPVDMFLEANLLATRSGKPRGTGINHEPLEFAGLLWCLEHDEPKRISSSSSAGVYSCQTDYVQGRGPTCFNIASRYLDEPLVKILLSRLDFTSMAEDVLIELESGLKITEIEARRYEQEISILERRLKSLETYLGCGDPAREELYWRLFQDTKRELDAKKSEKPTLQIMKKADYQTVRNFLKDLPKKWPNFSPSLRNRLWKLLIERIEINHQSSIVDVRLRWKTGQTQMLKIMRTSNKRTIERLWSAEDLRLLERLWPSATHLAIAHAFPDRTWKAINNRANKLGLRRSMDLPRSWSRRRWTTNEESKGKLLYESGESISDIVAQMGRTRDSIVKRVRIRGWSRPKKEAWKVVSPVPITNRLPDPSNGISLGYTEWGGESRGRPLFMVRQAHHERRVTWWRLNDLADTARRVPTEHHCRTMRPSEQTDANSASEGDACVAPTPANSAKC